ncbi:aspartate kinase homoserine dehydrogenase, partial [Ramaria rubella]
MSLFNVAVIGVGLVGKEFISQLLSLSSPTIRLVSVSSSTRTHFSAQGLTASDWHAALSKSTSKPNLSNLLAELTSLNTKPARVVVVDNTSSESVAAFCPEFLKAGIHVITPNKKAWSGELTLWQQIQLASKGGESKMLGEATVGAGLPIVGTLKDLVGTGDKVIKIEGVLSGTLSYIFNEFSTVNGSGPLFSSVVKIAKEKGFTEPHPADDLTGSDVARKLTILSRHIPSLAHLLPHGYASVDTVSLVPAELENIATGDEFLAKLPAFDSQFDKLRTDAAKEGMVLRFVGIIDVQQRNVKASLEKYPVTHPFATSLGG